MSAKSDATTQSKLFGKYHEIVLLLAGFILTTIVGGLLANEYQQKAWQHELASKRYDAKLDAATKVCDDLESPDGSAVVSCPDAALGI